MLRKVPAHIILEIWQSVINFLFSFTLIVGLVHGLVFYMMFSGCRCYEWLLRDS